LKKLEYLWEEWKEIYLVGTEWENYDQVFEINWDFSHLEEALAEGGLLREFGKKHPVYLFGSTEPQLVQLDANEPDEQQVVMIPVIVCVVCKLAPPSLLSLKSVQKIEEEIIPMQQLKMEWIPYKPNEDDNEKFSNFKPFAYFLKCFERKFAVAKMAEEERVEYQYALPYIFLPRSLPEFVEDTEVNCFCTLLEDSTNKNEEEKERAITFDYDSQFDEVNEKVEEVLESYGLDRKYFEEIKQTLLKTVKDKKIKSQEEKEERKQPIQKLEGNAKVKKALESLKTYKFYPKNEKPNIAPCKVSYINRYYGKADVVL